MSALLTAILYQGEKRMQISFPYDAVGLAKVKSIRGRKWSMTLKSWHLPYSKEAIRGAIEFFPDINFDPILLMQAPNKSVMKAAAGATLQKMDIPVPLTDVVDSLLISTAGVKTFPTHQTGAPTQKAIPLPKPLINGQVILEISPKKLFLRMAKKATDITFIRSLKYNRWNPVNYLWEITHTPSNVSLLRNYFNTRLEELAAFAEEEQEKTNPTQNKQLSVFITREGRLRLVFVFEQRVVNFIKKLPYPRWDQANRWWSVADSEKIRADIQTFITSIGWSLIVEKQSPREVSVPHQIKLHHPNLRSCPVEFVEKLSLRRYSPHTIRSYSHLFEEYINFYTGMDPKELTEKEVMSYLRHLVEKRQVSHSYQNQAINAIKFYYE